MTSSRFFQRVAKYTTSSNHYQMPESPAKPSSIGFISELLELVFLGYVGVKGMQFILKDGKERREKQAEIQESFGGQIRELLRPIARRQAREQAREQAIEKIKEYSAVLIRGTHRRNRI